MKKIPLTKGMSAIVDDCDYEKVSKLKWHASKNRCGYYAMHVAKIGAKKKYIYMHRMVMNATEETVDHIDGDTLNNSRNNLRACTHSENLKNQKLQTGRSSKWKGVYKNSCGSWTVQIKESGIPRVISGIKNENIAGIIYDLLARDRFGEYARYNFPEIIQYFEDKI